MPIGRGWDASAWERSVEEKEEAEKPVKAGSCTKCDGVEIVARIASSANSVLPSMSDVLLLAKTAVCVSFCVVDKYNGRMTCSPPPPPLHADCVSLGPIGAKGQLRRRGHGGGCIVVTAAAICCSCCCGLETSGTVAALARVADNNGKVARRSGTVCLPTAVGRGASYTGLPLLFE